MGGAFCLATIKESMHMERELHRAMTHESMHALEMRISNIDRGISVHGIAISMGYHHAIPHVDERAVEDHQLSLNHDIKSPRDVRDVSGVS